LGIIIIFDIIFSFHDIKQKEKFKKINAKKY
jgi:hypothetical protein